MECCALSILKWNVNILRNKIEVEIYSANGRKKISFIYNIVNKVNWKLVVKTSELKLSCPTFIQVFKGQGNMYLTALIIKKCMQVLELLKKINTNWIFNFIQYILLMQT